MLKFYCFLTGDNYTMVANDTPKSKQKVALMANALILPVLVWAINGFLMTHNILGGRSLAAVSVALICALIIFIVERIIIMSTASLAMKKVRIVMGVCTALLGALALDEVVFKQDIDYKVSQNRFDFANKAALEKGNRFDAINQMDSKQKDINLVKIKYDESIEKATNEMDGKGSGIKGVGKIANKKLELASNRKQELDDELKKFNSLLEQKSATVDSARKEAANQFKDGLMVRIEAFFQLVFSSVSMGLSFLAFFIVMFIIEFIVVLVKASTPETTYEKKVKLIEQIAEKRMGILSEDNCPLVDPAYILPNAISAHQSINKNVGLFN